MGRPAIFIKNQHDETIDLEAIQKLLNAKSDGRQKHCPGLIIMNFLKYLP